LIETGEVLVSARITIRPFVEEDTAQVRELFISVNPQLAPPYLYDAFGDDIARRLPSHMPTLLVLPTTAGATRTRWIWRWRSPTGMGFRTGALKPESAANCIANYVEITSGAPRERTEITLLSRRTR
jgi:hypothetical protein